MQIVSRIYHSLKRLPAACGVGGLAMRRAVPSRPIIMLIVCGTFLIMLVVGVVALILSNLRDRAIDETNQQLLTTATMLSKQAARDFEAIELVEANLIEHMETVAIVSDELYRQAMAGRDVHLMLKEKINGFPHIDSMMLIGADGKLINTSRIWPIPPMDVSGQDYFEALKTNPQLSSVLGSPVQDHGTGAWMIYLGRKFIGPNGEFLGAVVGAVKAQYFEQFYRTLIRGPDDSIALGRSDGLMLARYPHADYFMGKSLAATDLYLHRLVDSSQGLLTRYVSPVDGKERLIAGTHEGGSSPYVAVTRTVSAALADWRTEAEYLLGLTIVLVVAIGGIGAVIVQHFRRQSLQLDLTLNNLSQGVCMFDANLRLILSNDRYAEIFELPPEMTKPGTPLRQILEYRISKDSFSGGDPAEYVRRKLSIALANQPANIVTDFRDGRAVATVVTPMPGGGFVATQQDITEQKRAERRIAHVAHHDALTGLPNRAAFSDHLAHMIEGTIKADRPFAILCLDLDRFKEVNDLYGHPVGDALLREVARRLQAVAEGCFFARVGGDEFILITEWAPQAEAAGQLAERLQAALHGDIEIDGCQLRIGLSVGIASCPKDGSDPTSLLANADVALYRAKAEGRGAIRFFEVEMAAQLRDRRELQHDLQSAIANSELRLDYQPLARIDGEIVGFETLARWNHPGRGLVSPGVFIPLAEENGLIVALGEWILRSACREAASWPNRLQISVNLSPVQFRNDDIVRLVHAILMETGLTPGRLELEITEGVLIDDFARAVSILRRLKSLGVRIALDDFGTGYSSMSYLQAFPFDKIKIDRSFISNLEDNAQSKTILRAVIGLARGLDLPVTAEGVETQAQLDLLARAGCDLVQGFLIGRPAPIVSYSNVTHEARVVGTSISGRRRASL